MAVYLVQAGENGPCKIGKANDIPGRIRALQSAHVEQLRLLRTWKGGLAEEKALHRQFDYLRINREWFSFCPSMLSAKPVTDLPPKIKKTRAWSSLKKATPHAMLITDLGGPGAVARELGCRSNRVVHWQSRGIPPVSWDRIVELAASLGIKTSRDELRQTYPGRLFDDLQEAS